MQIARVKLTIGGVTFETGDPVMTPDGEGAVLSADPFADREILVFLVSGEWHWYSWRDVTHMKEESPMVIKEVGYGFTFNVGNYQSERIDCHVELEDGETPEQALDKARMFVQAQHKRGVEALEIELRISKLKGQEDNARSRTHTVVNQWRVAVERYDELRALLQQHGVEIKPLDSYYLPPAKEDLAQVDGEEDDDEDDEGDFDDE